VLKRLGAILVLAGCSGGTLPVAPSAPAPALELRANATLSYAGTLKQTDFGGVVKTSGVTENVTAASTAGKNVVNYHGQSVQTAKGGPLTTTFDAVVAQVRSRVRQGNAVTRINVAVSDSSGISATTAYGKGNGVFDYLPEVNGSAWSNTAAGVVSAASSQAGSKLEDRFAADGSYDERAVPVEGLKAFLQSYPDGNAVYQWPFGGAYQNSTIAYTPPKYGMLRMVFTDAVHHVTDLIQLHSWYPSRPLVLTSDTTKNAGSVRLPKSCRVAPRFGTMATELDETATRVDIVFGEYETVARTSYLGKAGLLCLHVHDVLQTHYDYNAFAFAQKPLTTTTADEVLGLRQAGGASGTAVSSAAAIPLDANVAIADTALRLQDATAIFTSLQRIKAAHSAAVAPASAGKIASIVLTLQDAYPPGGKAMTTPVHVTALDANGNAITGTYASPIRLTDADKTGATKLSTTSVASSSTHVALAYDGSPLSSARLTAFAAGAPKATTVLAPSPTTVAQYKAPFLNTHHGPLPLGVSDLCIGPDGNVWATGASSGAILKIDSSGHYTIYPLLGTEPLGISVGSDGNLWFAEGAVGKIGRITVAGAITQYTIRVPKGGQSQPSWTAPGPDKRTWFVDQGFDAVGIGAISMSGKMVKYALPRKSGPQSIVAGPDGNMWITDPGLNAVDVMSTSGKILAIHRLHTASAAPWGIAIGPDKNLWFAEFGSDFIGRMTPSGKVREFAVPSAFAGPLNVAAGPDGKVWFTETGGGFWNFAGKIGYVTTDGKTIRDFPSFNPVAHVHDLAFDTHGNLWYSKFDFAFSSLSKLVY
jgi:streptogramin lyase